MAGPLPETFGRYRILRPLGAGGMGSVYLARDTQLDRLVALKVPHLGGDDRPAPDTLRRFFREARAAAALLHPNLCPIFDVSEIDGTPYLTMAYLEGRPLADLVRGKKRLSQRQATVMVRKLAMAMHEAHARGVIHRDLKPSNVMVNPRGEPIVMDFGLARRDETVEARLTKPGAVLGTPAYMAPEQIQGEPDAVGPACDIYALGVIFYELLTGHLPFEGSVLTVLGRILTQAPPPPSKHRPDIEPQLEAICLRAMAKEADDRFASMGELAAALAAQLRTIRETLGSTPAPGPDAKPPADRVAGASDDTATQVSHETLFARDDPGRSPPQGETPSPRPGWRDQDPKPEPRRSSPPRHGWLLSAAALGSGALLLLGYATFSGSGDRTSSGGRGRATSPRSDIELTPTPPSARPGLTAAPRGPRPTSPDPGAVLRSGPEPPTGRPPAAGAPASRPLVGKGSGSEKAGPGGGAVSTADGVVRTEPAPQGSPPPRAAQTGPEPPRSTPAPAIVKAEPESKAETSPPRAAGTEARLSKAAHPTAVEPGLLTTRVGQIRLKRIPAGTFLMGSPDAEGIASEHPRHGVRISRAFYLGIFEVTQAQYRAVMAENPSHFAANGRGRDKVAGRSTDDHPVDNISWLDAVRFCNVLSEREGLEPYYEIDDEEVQIPARGGTGYRLPTESEWEYACRAGGTTRYNFGDGEAGLPEHAWYRKVADEQTHPVGRKRPNAWGLHDMHGNVWEWCWDRYDPNSYRRTSPDDPTGPPDGTHRILRGGSFNDYPIVLRCATRVREAPARRDWVNGLRLARTGR
jgi:formylglycine-generating enzyme required for sulfatase activity/serine/threonine protein kinase